MGREVYQTRPLNASYSTQEKMIPLSIVPRTIESVLQ
jgi:hypothetical protein